MAVMSCREGFHLAVLDPPIKLFIGMDKLFCSNVGFSIVDREERVQVEGRPEVRLGRHRHQGPGADFKSFHFGRKVFGQIIVLE
jgi:hypothetical protein